MRRAHKIAITAMCVSLLSILLGLAHVFSLIIHAPRFWEFADLLTTAEYAVITYLVWKY